MPVTYLQALCMEFGVVGSLPTGLTRQPTGLIGPIGLTVGAAIWSSLGLYVGNLQRSLE